MRRALTALAAIAAAFACPSAAGAQGLDLSCQFSLTRLDATTTNVLAVDTNAVYWSSPYAALPGTRIRIEGRFPHSRYMSWNVYDGGARPIDALSDRDIQPDPGSLNPFLPGADRLASDRDYTAFVEFGPKPAEPAPNTLYTGDSGTGTFIYRIYIPDDGRDAMGGVPLPKVTLEPEEGSGGAPGVEACRETQAPFLEGVNEEVAGAPALSDPTDDGQGYPGRNPPDWELFVNFSKSAVDILFDNETAGDFHDEARNFETDNAGFFSNRDIAYVFTGTSRGHGEVLVLHGRAPTFADTRSGAAVMPTDTQLRYWSFCQYEPATQRVIGCAADDRVAVGADGYYTVVVSTAEQRPANARPECGVTWIPWGPQTQGLLIYRHMLADPSFEQSIQNVPEPGLEEQTMGEYTPTGTYLPDKAAFEARGC